jgi:hypothetical protein
MRKLMAAKDVERMELSQRLFPTGPAIVPATA